MNKICGVCGHAGENIWRDGKYYCASCGSEIDTTSTENAPVAPETVNNGAIVLDVVCPVCKNKSNNYLLEGQCHCSMCGTVFNMQESMAAANTQNNNTAPASPVVNNGGYSAPGYPNRAARRAALVKEKNSKMAWGIFWLIFFWPIGAYKFYQMYQISKEIDKLDMGM